MVPLDLLTLSGVFTMGSGHQVGRPLKGRVSKSRRGRHAKREKYRPTLEGLEQRTLLTGFWTSLQATNFSSGPIAGTQALMLLSNGVVMAGQDTAPNAGFNSVN